MEIYTRWKCYSEEALKEMEKKIERSTELND